MLRLFVLLTSILALATSASISGVNLSNGRIVGGKVTDIVNHPHQVSIRYKGCSVCAFRHSCGGSIISEKIILTAAHCVQGDDPKLMQVVAGANERYGHGVMVPVKNFVYHKDYDRYVTHENDIAILVLESELPLNGHNIKAIKMADIRPEANEMAQISGWGVTSENGHLSDLLQEVEIPIISNDVCESRYGKGRITSRMLCTASPTGGKDACTSDSGGPLVVNGELAGVVSWGTGCGRPEYPGVYVSVADLRPWIDEVVGENS